MSKANVMAMSPRSAISMTISAVLAQALCANVAQAQRADALEEVLVTATRRAESVQDVPLNITALGGEDLIERGISNLADLGRTVPGLYVLDQGQRQRGSIVVRGLNSNPVGTADGNAFFRNDTVSTYVGELPLYIDLRPDDIERVEVLLGPQGTLYGAGTLGGAIRYLPRRPDLTQTTLSLRADTFVLSESDDPGLNGGFIANVPFTDTLALRASVNYLDDPGFTDYPYVLREPGVSNPQPDLSDPTAVAANLHRVKDADFQKVLSGRIALRWQPSERFDANLTHYYQKSESGGRSTSNVRSFGTGPYEAAFRFTEPSDRTTQLTALEITADLGFAELTSASGYATRDDLGRRDQTDLNLSFGVGYELFPSFSVYTRDDQEDKAFTEELRLVSKSEGPWKWIAGAFYNDFDLEFRYRETAPGFSAFAVDVLGGIQERPDEIGFISATSRQVTEQALFAELGYQFTDAWQVTAGARRFGYELKRRAASDLPLLNTVFFGAPPDQITLVFQQNGQKENGTLFKFNTSYRFSEDLLGYATVSEGYRIGGTNGVAPCPDPLPPGQQNVCGRPDELLFQPDTTTNYELGVRSQWLDRRLTINGTIYHVEWKDPQLAGITQNGGVGITKNGKGAESRGAELSFALQAT
ncbi:MAG: TonB-dependent receptor, partial [Steroidobacteraceae bacterium]